jgi:hypothetical protein
VMRMLTVSAVDFVIGSIPLIGDAFDLWFKANTRNLGLLRRHLEQPDTSTRGDWMIVTGLVGVIIAIVAILGWLLVSLVSALAGLLS